MQETRFSLPPTSGPAFIDKSADLALAVKRIMDSKTFDNGTICASEQSFYSFLNATQSGWMWREHDRVPSFNCNFRFEEYSRGRVKVRDLVSAAKEAQAELAEKSQEEVDRIVKSIADAGVRNAARLAVMANEDTGFGIVEDKVVKNVFGSYNVYNAIKDMKTIGVI